MSDAERLRLSRLARYIAAGTIAFAEGTTFDEVYYAFEDSRLGEQWYELAALVERRSAELLQANHNHTIPGDGGPALQERWTLIPRRRRTP